MEYRWTVLPEHDEAEIKSLSTQLNNLDLRLSRLLIQRGINTFDKAKSFFRPTLDELHSPFLMQDMQAAVDRIVLAMNNEENILIYGDYDVDGTTSVAMVFHFLNRFYPNMDYYIPDRYQEGYGISIQGIDFAADNDISLIIALDCGIKAVEKIAYAKEKGVDFIICDHHTPGETIPKASAVLDPKRKDCNYPYKELSGCGVGFKLLQAWCDHTGNDQKVLFGYLDFLAVSIAADIVPITGENRILCYYGLKQLNEAPHLGFRTMLRMGNFNKPELSIMDVVFTLAPRINAAGRMESGKKAVELMISEGAVEAQMGTAAINENNLDRRTIDASITLEALKMIAEDNLKREKRSTVLYNKNWHKGVIGIVASRCIEQYYKPTIILTESNGKASGSARSVKGFSVYEAIEACGDLLTQFGGHKYAAGLTMPIGNIPAFKDKFEKVVASRISEDQLQPEILIDCELDWSSIHPSFFKILKQMAPFGPMNMQPIFLLKNAFLNGKAKVLKEKHLKFDISPNKDAQERIACIAFNQINSASLLNSGKAVDIAFQLEENHWRGNVSLQLMVKGIRRSTK